MVSFLNQWIWNRYLIVRRYASIKKNLEEESKKWRILKNQDWKSKLKKIKRTYMEKPSKRSRQKNQRILKKSKSPTSAQKCASSVSLLAQTKKSKFLEHDALRAPGRHFTCKKAHTTFKFNICPLRTRILEVNWQWCFIQRKLILFGPDLRFLKDNLCCT